MPDTPKIPPRPTAVPGDRAWFDPPLVTANLYTRTTDITFAGAGVKEAGRVDHSRWAIGFIPGVAAPSSLFCHPWPDVTVSPGWDCLTEPPPWFRLVEFGSLVVDAWYVSAGGPGVVRIVEILRRTSGG